MEPIIQIKNLSKNFKKIKALDNISLEIQKNTIFGLLGSNGAGKTTLIHILMGLLKYEGKITYFQNPNLKTIKNKLALVPQKLSLYDDLSIFDNLYFFGRAYKLSHKETIKKIENLQKQLQLGDLQRKVKILSGGFQKRVSIAVALIGEPEILILDEALVGIDIITKKIITEILIKLKKSKTIILTTHSIDEAERLCNEIAILHKGKLILKKKTSELLKENDYTLNLEEIMINLIEQ